MPSTNDELSERELEILRLVATGASNKEIAGRLFISANTVKVHLRNIFAKINVSSRTEAAMYAVSAGIVPAADLAQEAPEAEEDSIPALSIVSPEPLAVPVPDRQRFRWLWVITGIVIALLVVGLSIYAVRQARAPQATLSVALDQPQRWQALEPMPIARYGLAISVIETNLYAIAGMTPEGITSAVERYDVPSGVWTAVANKPTPVYEVGAVVIGGRIYVPGGRLASDKPTDVLEIYDPYQDTWSKGAPLPATLSAYAIAALEGKMYVIGGWDGQRYVASVYQYDPGGNEWKARTPMLTARGYAAAVTSGGKILVLGGFDGKSHLDASQVYQPSLDDGSQQPWSQAAPLPEKRSRLAAASIADAIYVVGGENDMPTGLSPLQYDLASNAWLQVEDPLSQPWVEMGMAVIGTKLYGLGGQLSGVPSAQNFSYQAIYTVVLPLIRR
jgi:DNA-binding CsgD family transcriptional regulator